MRLAVVSARAWRAHPEAALALLGRIVGESSHTCVLLDAASIQQEAKTITAAAPLPITVVPFSDWLKPGAVEDSVIDVHVIREAPLRVGPERALVLDCGDYRLELIAAALRECRQAWYPLDDWHRAFVALCDDVALLPVADLLAATFYCQPITLSDRNVRQMVNAHHSRAFVFRWFGRSVGNVSTSIALKIKQFQLWLEREK